MHFIIALWFFTIFQLHEWFYTKIFQQTHGWTCSTTLVDSVSFLQNQQCWLNLIKLSTQARFYLGEEFNEGYKRVTRMFHVIVKRKIRHFYYCSLYSNERFFEYFKTPGHMIFDNDYWDQKHRICKLLTI